MIECYDLTVPDPHGDSLLFDSRSFEIDEGEWVDVVGSNGAGKSVLFSILVLEARPEHGRLIVAGRNVDRIDASDLAELRRTFGTARQPVELLEHRTVLENVLLPSVVRGEVTGARRRAETWLDEVGLRDLSERPASKLSRGERKAVAVVRACIGEPRAVAVDGGLADLDGEPAEAVETALQAVHDAGATVLLFGCRPSDCRPPDAHLIEL